MALTRRALGISLASATVARFAGANTSEAAGDASFAWRPVDDAATTHDDATPTTGAPEPELLEATLAEGTRFETPAFVLDSRRSGPTVAIIAGIHGNETAPPRAARLLLTTSLHRGRLFVVPEVNRPALAAGSRFTPRSRHADLNRNFPAGARAHPRGEMAPALWEALGDLEPDWVFDLHEGWGFSASSASMGSSVVCANAATRALDHACRDMAETILTAVNRTVTTPSRRFTLLRPGPAGSLARSLVDAAVPSLVFETTWVQAIDLRVAQQRLMVAAALTRLGMLRD